MIEIIVDIKPFLLEYEERLLKYLIIPGHYKELINSELEILNSKMIKYNKKYNLNITLNLLYSMRSAHMNEKIMITYGELKKNRKRICRLFNDNNKDVIYISKEFDLSPEGNS